MSFTDTTPIPQSPDHRRDRRPRYNVDAVRAALTGERVLSHFGITGRGTRQIKLKECPSCKLTRRSGGFSVNAETADWIHHGGPGGEGPCRGDGLDLIAALAGLDIKTQWWEVVELGAQIGGIGPDADSAEVERIIAEGRARREATERRAAEERARGEALVPGIWDGHRARHPVGERYLAGRGLDPEGLRDRDLVRYDRYGNPSVAIRSFDTGAVINIARRRLDHKPGDELPKCLTLSLARVLGVDSTCVVGSLSTRGSLVGQVSHAAWNGSGIAVLVEGIMDALTAAQMYGASVTATGANGCDNMVHVAEALAPIVAKVRGGVLLVGVHRDDEKQGVVASANAMRAAIRAGLELRSSVRGIEIGEHKDLNDAWCAGWRDHWRGVAA